MATNRIDLTSLFSQNFFVTPSGKVEIKDFDGSKNVAITEAQSVKFEEGNLVNVKSKSGKYGAYYKPDKRGQYVFMPLTLDGLLLPYCWISVKGNKRIVETSLTERRGQVREFIGMDDWEFSVKGFIIGHDGTFPEEDLEQLLQLFEKNTAVIARSILTDIVLLTPEQSGQDNVVMYNLDITDNQGVEHVRGYSFTLKSDQQFELEILD